MKFTATATATALATFFGAAPITVTAQTNTGKSGKGMSMGKSGKGKSSKSDSCTYCSAETLDRATLLTDLTFDLFAADGILNSTEIIEGQSNPNFDLYLETVENIAGCLIYAKCWVESLAATASTNSTLEFSKTQFLMRTINQLCEAERTGERSCDSLAPSISLSPSQMPSISLSPSASQMPSISLRPSAMPIN
jgi:hypothetical protein